MNNPLTVTAPTAIAPAQPFDTSILAGNVSESTRRQYEAHFKTYLRFAADHRLNGLEATTLARWRQHLYETGYMIKRAVRDAEGNFVYNLVTYPSGRQRKVKQYEMAHRDYTVNSINQRLAAVRSVMKLAAEQGYIPLALADSFENARGLKLSRNPGRRKQNARTPISARQMRRLCDAPDTSDIQGLMHRALLLTLATSGARVSEVVTLQKDSIVEWSDSRHSSWGIYVMGKNRSEAHRAPLATEAKNAIDAWLDARPVDVDWVFTGFSGAAREQLDTPISRQAAWQIVKRYAGGLPIKPHDFRRFTGTRLAEDNIKYAQNALGHRSSQTTLDNYVLTELPAGITENLF